MHSPELGHILHDTTQAQVAAWRERQQVPSDLIYCRRCRIDIRLAECVRYLDAVKHDWGPKDSGGIDGRPTHLSVMACTADSKRAACPYYSKRKSVPGPGSHKVLGHDGVVRIHGRPWNGKDKSKFNNTTNGE